MILIKEGTDFYLLYTPSAQFLGNGSMDTIRRIIRKYAKRAGGSRSKFNALIDRIYWKGNTYKLHEEYIINLWEQKYRDIYEEELESLIGELLAENKIRKSIPKVKILAKKETPKRKGIIRLRH